VSSKRRQRRKACIGKVRHDSRATAAAAVRGRHWLNAYECPHCTGWHIGHPTARQRQAARIAMSERRHVA
jgi:hypothetical protein